MYLLINSEIVLVAPFWSQSDGLNWDSAYVYLRLTLPKLAQLLPNYLWLVLWPDANYGADKWKLYTDTEVFTERIVRIPWPYDTAIRSGVLGFDPVRWQYIDLNYGPTLFCLHQMELATFMHSGYKQAFAAANRPTLISHPHFVIHKSLPYPVEAAMSRLLLQINSSIVSDALVLNSDHTKYMLMEMCGDYLNKKRLAEIESRCHVIKHGLVSSEVDIPIRSYDKPVILYNHRFESYKNYKVTGEIIKDLKQRHDFEVWVTQTEGQRAGMFPLDRVVGHPKREQYLENIAVPAINTINSSHETYCIAIMDSLCLGHLVVAPNAVTFPELLPKDYPFLFNSVKEQTQMLDHILETWPQEYEKWSPVLRAYVATNFALDKYIRDYADLLIAEGSVWQNYGKKEKTEKGLDKFFTSLDSGVYTLKQLHSVFKKRQNLGDQAFPPRRFVRELSLLGANFHYRDDKILVEWKK